MLCRFHAVPLAALALALCTTAASAHADAIYTGGNLAVAADGHVVSNNGTTSSSFSTTNGTAKSQIDGVLNPAKLGIAYTQSGQAGDATDASFFANFTITDTTAYTITDAAPVVTGSATQQGHSFLLQDLTSGNVLYLDTNGGLYGALMGTLVGGHSYYATGAANLNAGGTASLSYDQSLTFGTPASTTSTPEPSSFALLGTGILGAAGAVRRRLRV